MSCGVADVRKLSLTICLLLAVAQSLSPFAPTQGRPSPTPARGPDVERDTARINVTSLYRESHVLVIGISRYDHWADLPGVVKDVEEIKGALTEHGFTVEVAKQEDLVSDRLYPLIKKFVSERGLNPENRLLIYYAGHGYRRVEDDGTDSGFILPSDTPPLGDDPAPFLSKAIGMGELLATTQGIRAKHALFVLDTCYAGSLINAAEAVAARPPVDRTGAARFDCKKDSNLPPCPPPHIRAKVEGNTRQIIASGMFRQQVPDKSEFRRRFVAGLTDESGGGADLDGDSYVTVSELGEYLQKNVTNTSEGSQQPTWGWVGTKAANPGDFVFVMPGATAKELMLGPLVDPVLWDIPRGWRLAETTLDAPAPGLMLPRNIVNHSFRDFESVTRLKLANNTAANFVLRAQSRQDYYLLRLAGGGLPDGERLSLQAWVVRGGRQMAQLKGSPLSVKVRELERAFNYKDALQVVISAVDNRFEVRLQLGEGNARGLPLLAPVRFVDPARTFRYGAPGLKTEAGERLQILSVHVYKSSEREKGRI